MEVLDELGSNELMLGRRAAAMHVPFAGTFELLPICNMDCRMCYVRTTKKDMDEQGRMLTADEWIRIAEEAKELGLLYLLLTGGEPLLYPEFEKLYIWLNENGVIVMLNTNGTMLNDHYIDLLKKYPPRKVNISLYGANAKTYGDLCGFPTGFERVIENAGKLKEANIPVKFNSSLTPLNVDDLEEMHAVADRLDIPLQATPYMFPPIRKCGVNTEQFLRFEPKEAARIVHKNARIALKTEERYLEWCKGKMKSYGEYQKNPYKDRLCGIGCFASKNNFWLNWKGEMAPCTMMTMKENSVLKDGFATCWERVGTFGKEIMNSGKCCKCDKAILCNVCAAASLAETGAFDGTPDYLCEMTAEVFRLLKEAIPFCVEE